MSGLHFRLAGFLGLLCIAACTAANSVSEGAPGRDAPASGASAAPPEPSRHSDPVAAAEAAASPSLGPWDSLFRLEYDDPSAIEAFLAEVRKAPGTRRTILLKTTLSWGCACPTWVFPFHQDMSVLQYLMVLPAPALELDPTDLATPERAYRLTGRFNGVALTGLDWARARKDPPPNFPKASLEDPEVQEYWTVPGLVFIVEDWCFERNPNPDDSWWLRERGATECPD